MQSYTYSTVLFRPHTLPRPSTHHILVLLLLLYHNMKGHYHVKHYTGTLLSERHWGHKPATVMPG